MRRRFPKPPAREPKPPKRLVRNSSPIARKTRPRRQRKTTLAALKRKLWTLFAAYVKERDGNKCFTCDKGGLEGQNWHAGHFIKSTKASTRYDPANVHSQCGYCNCWMDGNGPEYAYRFLILYGREKFDALMLASREIRAWKAYELEELIEALKKGGADYECLYAERYGA